MHAYSINIYTIYCIRSFQWESASRHYSKSGFLGVILNRVTNQLVSLCRMVLLTNTDFNSEAIWGSDSSQPSKEELEAVVASLSECLALHKCYKVYILNKILNHSL